MDTSGVGRRRALTGAAGIGIGLPVLAACGSDEEAAPDPTDTPAGGESSDAAGGVLGTTADVPVGGGMVYADQKVVVTQPTEGEFKAFSAVCTHQGCVVGQVKDEQIECPCHGSAFSAVDGSVTNGPAENPLEEVSIDVEGDQITLA